MGSFISLTAADGTAVLARAARPEGPVRGAVVVAQEIFGVNSHIRACYSPPGRTRLRGDRPGVHVLGLHVQLGYDAEGMARGKALKAAAEALPVARACCRTSAPRRNGPCSRTVWPAWTAVRRGGLLAWRAAERVSKLSAAVCYYGGGMTVSPELARTPRVPVLATSTRDAHIALDGVQAFSRAHPGVQVHVYDADHGFNCDQRGSYDETSATHSEDDAGLLRPAPGAGQAGLRQKESG